MAKSDFISKANNVFYLLKSYELSFEKEAKIINNVKCLLLQNKEIEDFYVDGNCVNVENIGDSYLLFYDSYMFELKVQDKRIINFEIYNR